MDVELPAVYIVNRHLDIEHAYPVMNALAITPVHCAVIFDIFDAALALELCPNVVRAASEADALALALMLSDESEQPVLMLGNADFLDAVYMSGNREVVVATC